MVLTEMRNCFKTVVMKIKNTHYVSILFLLKASILKAVQKKIEEIDETFHLVMILEEFQVQ